MKFILVSEIISKRKVSSVPLPESVETLVGEIGNNVQKVFVDSELSINERRLVLRTDRIKLIEELTSDTCKIYYMYESSDESNFEFSDYTTTYVVKSSINSLLSMLK